MAQETVRGTPPPDKKLLEHHFVFACIWAFGGTMLVDKVSDYRLQFSKWWVMEWKAVQFPEKVRASGLLLCTCTAGYANMQAASNAMEPAGPCL